METFEAQSHGFRICCLRFVVIVTDPNARLASGLGAIPVSFFTPRINQRDLVSPTTHVPADECSVVYIVKGADPRWPSRIGNGLQIEIDLALETVGQRDRKPSFFNPYRR